MDYYAVAERLLREGRKAKAFDEYKKTDEYQIRLHNKAAELQNMFESRRNTRILELVESESLPNADDVVRDAVDSVCEILRTSRLLIEADAESFHRTDLNEMQHFDALDLLEKQSLIHIMYAHMTEP